MEWEELVPNSQDVLDAVRSLRDGDGLADMQIDLPWELGNGTKPSGDGTIVVVDTNILISHLPLLRSFVGLCTSLSPSKRPTLLIPHIVLRELDGLKTSARSTDIPVHATSAQTRPNRMNASISTLARAATNWLLSVIPSASTSTQNPSIVRGQRKSETLFSQHAVRGENNDSLVLDAATFFVHQSKRVVLLSDDNNLRLRAKFEQVEALTVAARIGNDPEKLLASLDSSIVHTPPSTTTPPPMTNGHAYTSEPSRIRSRSPRSPRARTTTVRSPPPLSPRSKATPIPLPSTIARSSSMELDPSHSIPLHPSSHPPTLFPPTTPSSIFSNLLILFSHFLALPLYRTVYEHFKCIADGGNERQRKVLEELGDWREWDAKRCADILRKWWDEGGIRELCERGYEKLHPTEKGSSPLSPPPPPPAPTIPQRRPSVPTSPVRQSRWASTAPASPPDIHSRALLMSPSPPGRPSLSPSSALSTLHSTLPYLISTFSLPPSSTTNWSSIRFEILLEAIGNWLVVLLSGILRSSVKGDLERLVRGWEGDLRGVGIGVERVRLTMS
ncbi:hypothetical protein JCM16303_006996 [Sporobolomyces ruberrimus]